MTVESVKWLPCQLDSPHQWALLHRDDRPYSTACPAARRVTYQFFCQRCLGAIEVKVEDIAWIE